MKVIERFLSSKTGNEPDCEDAIVVTRDFACVIDGATSQTEWRLRGTTTGRAAAELIGKGVAELRADATAKEAVDHLGSTIEEAYRKEGADLDFERQPEKRATASVVLFSRQRREVWLVGDCQALILYDRRRAERLANAKRADRITADARAFFLASVIAEGMRRAPQTASENELECVVEGLREGDPGRRFISPLLERQRCLQNPPSLELRGSSVAAECAKVIERLGFWVIDGTEVPESRIRVKVLPPDATSLVLASDGYPKLFPTRAQAEHYLQRVVRRDPLLIGDHRTTKAHARGAQSYDDRAWLKLDLR
jgi:glycerophosphoryl diester phosphodiesterase